ncbi:DUF4184 family protein [Lewinella sp. W8]|uniref:DUF4184 family protein n=1 Tax=Lewinella sp. W8 TaxID=2528208 RepID=UPI0010671A55|nr:DUF4184 family protein [Lewinella sp. W8]MTB51720.1 DUF4184 family protein [Lewinella sp. W8]
MPFTFSHPAIVLPLAKLPARWISVTGLVIGSLTPDFEYFLRMQIRSDYGHSLWGLFYFDLPLGLVLTFLFHGVVKQSLFQNLPVFLKSRFMVFMDFRWPQHFRKHWWVVMVSILIGAASHIFWDSFTHQHRYFAQSIPYLTTTIPILEVQVPGYKVLQHLSTLVGGGIILTCVFRLPVNESGSTYISRKYWPTIIGITLVIVILRFATGLTWTQYGQLIVTVISAGLISLVATPLLLNWIGNDSSKSAF